MVERVQEGFPISVVASQFGVERNTVRFWVKRSQGIPLDQMNWADRSSTPHLVHNRTSREMEQRILECRRFLASPENALGFIGPGAIRDFLKDEGREPPSLRTVARILNRNGILDQKVRRRFKAPPVGWYIPGLDLGLTNMDVFDTVEGLVIEGQGELEVLTTVSLWSPHAQAWPDHSINTSQILNWLISYWRIVGLPSYAQFDNDTRFQGAHHHTDVIGRVMRTCLSLGVTPVFAPPRETGFQALIENFNGLWQTRVWHRFHHFDLLSLSARSQRFISAYIQHRSARFEHTPARRPFPTNWKIDFNTYPQGKIIYIRRTNDQGNITILGRQFSIDPNWVHRLVRCEVELDDHIINIFRLRRRDPKDQPLLKTIEYHLPKRRSFRWSRGAVTQNSQF
jgi:putative transposase